MDTITQDYYYDGVSAALSAILAFNLFVYTLEVNDFRHRLKNAYLHPFLASINKDTSSGDAASPPEPPPSSPQLSTKRYIAALVATRLGLRDALFDWFTVYIILWAIVGGITYFDADQDSLLVLWGINAIISALVVADTSFKALQWLGLYRASRFQILSDTTGMARDAVKNLLGGGVNSASATAASGDAADDGGQGNAKSNPSSSTLTAYRYQVRLAVGTHFAKFAIFLLPFYVGLRAGFFVASVLVAFVFGHAFLYCVFKARERFDHDRDKVAIGSSVFLSLVAGVLFVWGMFIVDMLWKWNTSGWKLFLLSFFPFQGAMIIMHGLKYWEHTQFSKTDSATTQEEGAGYEEDPDDDLEDSAQLFVENALKNEPTFFRGNVFHQTEAAIEGVTGPSVASIQEEVVSSILEEANEGPNNEDEAVGKEVPHPLYDDATTGGQLIAEGGLEEPLLENPAISQRKPKAREAFAKGKDVDRSMGYFYETQYFDRVTLFGLHKNTKSELRRISEPDTLDETYGLSTTTVSDADVTEVKNGDDDDMTPEQMYKAFVAMEEGGRTRKWYHHVWQSLPLQPIWDLAKITCQHSCTCCCDKDAKFKKNSRCAKIWIVLRKTVAVAINLLALYVTIVACGATIQISRTKRKLPYVQKTLYNDMDGGQVCAASQKCGDKRTFDDAASAALSNYTVLHCGPCGHCSTWNDLELQWSTRHTLAEQSQACGIKTMFGGVDELSTCLATDIGFTENCADCWAEDIYCSKAFCIFIYLQSRMTNQLGNFEVGPNTITAATCEEANCEAGNPGEFVGCSGANRRRMDIKSAIKRPADQQCSIVGIPKGPDSSPDWETYFDPSCPRDVSPQLYN